MNILIKDNLFSAARVSEWDRQLAELQDMVLPEPWRFKKPEIETVNKKNYILEYYIKGQFTNQIYEYNKAQNEKQAANFAYVDEERMCINTGLFNIRYKPIYMYFEKNNALQKRKDWVFKGFFDESAKEMRKISHLPEKPSYQTGKYGIGYHAEWPIRINTEHILEDENNLNRIPASIRKSQILPIYFETAVEIGKRKAQIEPSLVVPNGFHGRTQYILPIFLNNMNKPNLGLVMTDMNGYYIGNTCLTLEMSYLNARLITRPTATWLTDLLDKK